MFNSRHVVDPATGCWNWVGYIHRSGYGRIKLKGVGLYAHRAAYAAAFGPIPEGMCVLHQCDNPPCVNPAHLRLGTHADNMREMVERGRSTKPKPPEQWVERGQKLTREQVERIREDRRICRLIAADYGVSRITIGKIRNYQLWRYEAAPVG